MKKMTIELTNSDIDYQIDESQEIFATFDGTGDKSVKTKLNFIHTKPHITSRIHIKAVLKDSARFDFEGVLKIVKGASGTDAYLKIDCLLVSDKAYARAIPSLEITENEVKGGHGATIGYIDPEQMYYLMSKGLSVKEAETEIIQAFLA
jgi:Fe-S cluster assembly protein SufD